jgi:CRISPR/Cas system endoribonuclease Cas6 (RAMP superfamily)
MQTKLVILSVSLQSDRAHTLSPSGLRSYIEAQLTEQGDPLRWAITAIDREAQTAQVEAVVTTDVPAP